MGGDATELLDVRLTASPPDGATPLSVTAPVEGEPPVTEVGDTVRLLRVGGVTVKIAETDVPSVAVIVAFVDDATALVEIAKEADELPAETVTLDGGTALALLEESFTVIPPVGACPLSVTVPVEGVPP